MLLWFGLLGLVALAAPIISMKRAGKGTFKGLGLSLLVSFGACSAAVCTQFYDIRHRLLGGDWSGIEDTIDALIVMSIVLLAVTVILNVFNLLSYSAYRLDGRTTQI